MFNMFVQAYYLLKEKTFIAQNFENFPEPPRVSPKCPPCPRKCPISDFRFGNIGGCRLLGSSATSAATRTTARRFGEDAAQPSRRPSYRPGAEAAVRL
ncbi:unnamed protein product [Nesidiocoris tenuis]|uniref:Uncharacterized protein n=1 Tax=Nesidiocoris tenuis TaxID=355587 RepID=A0A6H5HLZ7_9HEMI|nr:unnamed protein product [Nesidiocoris tenuis]